MRAIYLHLAISMVSCPRTLVTTPSSLIKSPRPKILLSRYQILFNQQVVEKFLGFENILYKEFMNGFYATIYGLTLC